MRWFESSRPCHIQKKRQSERAGVFYARDLCLAATVA
jgi:hypothetical protein